VIRSAAGIGCVLRRIAKQLGKFAIEVDQLLGYGLTFR
jgi:hypothetical protein